MISWLDLVAYFSMVCFWEIVTMNPRPDLEQPTKFLL